mmetsp:Transcript_2501/g.5751  ORF Transcript_2501/g.5751 Transcript_2501/m.5751 type:complete len:233 (-) Transcript_2501:298-996(-)
MLLKVAVCGPSISGKSTLIKHLQDLPTRSSFLSGYRLEFKEVEQVSENFDSSYQLIVLMFDLTDQDSLDETLEIAKLVSKTPKLLIGNKADLTNHRAVDHYIAVKSAKRLGLFYRELSSVALKEVEEIKEIIEDIVLAHVENQRKWKLNISLKQYKKLQTFCKWLSVTSMIQGLILLCYGSLLFLCLPDYQQWLGDNFMYVGTVIFMLGFLGFYGTKMKSMKNNYTEIVRST